MKWESQTLPQKKEREKQINKYFLTQLNNNITQHHLPLREIENLNLHKQCKESNTILSTFRLKKEPTQNIIHTRDLTKECIPCWLNGVHKINTGFHIFFNAMK